MVPNIEEDHALLLGYGILRRFSVRCMRYKFFRDGERTFRRRKRAAHEEAQGSRSPLSCYGVPHTQGCTGFEKPGRQVG